MNLKELLPEKLNSDRLWALGAYIALLIANAQLGLGIAEEQMTQLCYAVIAFVLGKSIRGTSTEGLVQKLVPAAMKVAEKKPAEKAEGE